jgi:hypothetical protein
MTIDLTEILAEFHGKLPDNWPTKKYQLTIKSTMIVEADLPSGSDSLFGTHYETKLEEFLEAVCENCTEEYKIEEIEEVQKTETTLTECDEICEKFLQYAENDEQQIAEIAPYLRDWVYKASVEDVVEFSEEQVQWVCKAIARHMLAQHRFTEHDVLDEP